MIDPVLTLGNDELVEMVIDCRLRGGRSTRTRLVVASQSLTYTSDYASGHVHSKRHTFVRAGAGLPTVGPCTS